MSAFSKGLKTRFGGICRWFFGKQEQRVAGSPMRANPPPAPPPIAVAPPPPAPPRASAQSQNGGGIQIPLLAVINAMPPELRARVKAEEVGDLAVPVPLEKVLSQLAQGAVKVPFGQIRQAVPRAFASNPDRDGVAVVLPLGEILSRLNPALLVRNPIQKEIEVPAEVSSPFGAGGRGLTIAQKNDRPVTPASSRMTIPAAAPDMAPARVSISAVPPPVPPASPIAPEPIFQPADLIRPIAPLPPQQPLRMSVPPVPSGTPTSRNGGTLAAPSEMAKASGETPAMSVELTALTEAWPAALRQEILQLNLSEARVALPVDFIETNLKRGRVVVAWKTLRAWIRPIPVSTVSAHDGAELELPLKIIAPMFLTRQKVAGKGRRSVAVDETIPNLFFGSPKPDAPNAPAAPPQAQTAQKSTDTNFYVWDDVSENARVDETEFKRKPSGGTEFVSRYATPNEIVSRAASLDGVAGVLIALPDGLMVANRIPPELNGDTLAAFLPQIFAKVSQATKELRMGELNNLNFTVGNVPWKIFRVNAIFFAAFGRAGEPLPTAQLAALAAEMDRKRSN